MDISEEQKKLLTPEELEGLLEDVDEDASEAYEADDKAIAQGADAAEPDGASDESDEANDKINDAADEVDDTAIVQAAADAELDVASDEGDEADDEATPHREKWQLPDDHEQHKQALSAQLEDLAVQFDEGDLTAREHLAKQKEVQGQLDKLNRAEILADVRKQGALDQWQEDVGGFLDQYPHYKDPELGRMLDQEVRKLQARTGRQTDPAHLEAAHRAISRRLSQALGQKVEDIPPMNDGRQKTGVKPRPERDVPKTLRNVPAAAVEDPSSEGEFAELEQLMERDPIAYENALSRMTDAQRDRFLSQ